MELLAGYISPRKRSDWKERRRKMGQLARENYYWPDLLSGLTGFNNLISHYRNLVPKFLLRVVLPHGGSFL